MNHRLLFLLWALLVSCKPSVHQKQATAPPIDTLEAIKALDIPEQMFRSDLVLEQRNGLEVKLDTLELRQMVYGCDCEDWIDYVSFYQAFPQLAKEKDKWTSPTQLKPFSYYIEPASPDLTLRWELCMTDNIIRFIGRKYKDPGYPENPGFIDPDPPKGNVFRYYGYEVQKPYNLWGPTYFWEIDSISGDSLFPSRVLTVD